MVRTFRKPLIVAFLFGLLGFSGLTFAITPLLVSGQTQRSISGTITSDTVWSKIPGYFNLTGNLTVTRGVTLTIAAGVSVQFNGYWLQIDGTLIAIGATSEQITFGTPERLSQYDAGGVAFSKFSASWNEDSGSGCIIENTSWRNSDGLEITGSSPKIVHNSLFYKIHVVDGSPIISDNYISGSVDVDGGAPVISNNTIDLHYPLGYRNDYVISLSGANSALVLDNKIHCINEHSAIVVSSGTPTIARNLVTNDDLNYGYGITIYGNTSPIIENNTITLNAIGICIYDYYSDQSNYPFSGSPEPAIVYNNIENNGKYSIYLGKLDDFGSSASDVVASNNWWGTIDDFTINQTIHDFKNSAKLGKVSFVPILTSPNTEGGPNSNLPFTIMNIPTPNPSSPNQTQTAPPYSSPPPSHSPLTTSISSNPNASPETDLKMIETAILIVLIIIAALLATLIAVVLKKR
jgi:parallel beta-helix repeat protein